ncbi:MAG: methyltransferase domain-containing protein [Alphaproteobacteria bacterium]|nr:methyltransferase domain-containing protein [Alphaproteobacteria bacterium]
MSATAPADTAEGEAFTRAQLDGHFAVLADQVFQVETKWPHFRLLLDDVRKLAGEATARMTVVSLERGLLYGGCSLFAPFFHHCDFLSVDCSPDSAEERGAYNGALIDDPRFLFVSGTHRAPIEATGLGDGIADLVLVPNLVHHIADQSALFTEMARITRPGGRVYVFEPIVRELHQMPDDYLRYTPFGLQRTLRDAGLTPGDFETEGGPFSAVAYCWAQALEYLPADQREVMARWFYEEQFPQLMEWDARYTENLERKHTEFPMAFSMIAEKPA